MWGRRSRRRIPPRPADVHPRRMALPVDTPVEELFVGGEPSPFTQDEEARLKRNEDAAELVDDDTMAYVVVRLVKTKGEPSGSLEVTGHVRAEWRGHFRAVLDRTARGITC